MAMVVGVHSEEIPFLDEIVCSSRPRAFIDRGCRGRAHVYLSIYSICIDE
jgi:hypothetical protein